MAMRMTTMASMLYRGTGLAEALVRKTGPKVSRGSIAD
jgi:hypothetical protein